MEKVPASKFGTEFVGRLLSTHVPCRSPSLSLYTAAQILIPPPIAIAFVPLAAGSSSLNNRRRRSCSFRTQSFQENHPGSQKKLRPLHVSQPGTLNRKSASNPVISEAPVPRRKA